MQKSTNYKANLPEGNNVIDISVLNKNITDIIDKGLILDVGESSGNANNYVLNLGSITLTSANKGISFKFWADKSSTGEVKINGTYNLVKANGKPIKNIKANAPYTITYDGNKNFFLSSGGADESDSTTVGTDGSKVLEPNTFIGSDGEVHTGTMPNKGAITANLNCGGSYTIPKGYHNGNGKVKANSLASQTSANATAGDILKNKTAWVNGSKITGAMPNLSADTPIQHESNNSTKVIEADGAFIGNNTDGVQRIGFRYNGVDGYITRNTLFGYPMNALRNDLGITANKIVAGNTIGGIAGTATLESLGGARKFIQRITVNEIKGQPDKHTINVGFKPRFVLCWVVTSKSNWHSQDLQLYSTDINGLQSGAWIQGHGSSSSGYWPKCKITGLHDNGFYYGDGKNTISKDETFQMDVIVIG